MSTPHPLIDAAALAARLDDPDLVVIDCRFNLMDKAAGPRAWAAAHLPGARYADLDADLAGPVTGTSGRHPLPAQAAFAASLSRWGVRPDSFVVAYDAAGGAMAAARLWWLLRWVGHGRAAVLDGGLPDWQRRGLPLTDAAPTVAASDYPVQPDDARWLGIAALKAALAAGESLVDARAAARYRGETEPVDPVAGHVPGALNLPQDGNLDAEGRFLPPAALAARFGAVLGERAPARVIHMCGSGVTACHNLLAMEAAGLTGSKLYAGSWSEWIRDPANPVATGAEP
ncbi:MAG: sulfurtransferase [Lysobacterales bacterium]|nr:MAG: sulfurtransferase [Xanthomonadales bacterium]